MAISYDDMDNNSPTVRVMALVCNNNGDWANNQTLPPTNGDTNNWVSNPSVDHHANLVPGNQYITIILPVFQTRKESVQKSTPVSRPVPLPKEERRREAS